MSKFGTKSERGNIKFYVFLGILIITFYFIGNMGVDKFKKNVKFAPAKVTSDFHYKNTFGGAGYDLLYYVNNKELVVHYKKVIHNTKKSRILY